MIHILLGLHSLTYDEFLEDYDGSPHVNHMSLNKIRKVLLIVHAYLKQFSLQVLEPLIIHPLLVILEQYHQHPIQMKEVSQTKHLFVLIDPGPLIMMNHLTLHMSIHDVK